MPKETPQCPLSGGEQAGRMDEGRKGQHVLCPHAGPQGGMRRGRAQAASGSSSAPGVGCGLSQLYGGLPDVRQGGLGRLELQGPCGRTGQRSSRYGEDGLTGGHRLLEQGPEDLRASISITCIRNLRLRVRGSKHKGSDS